MTYGVDMFWPQRYLPAWRKERRPLSFPQGRLLSLHVGLQGSLETIKTPNPLIYIRGKCTYGFCEFHVFLFLSYSDKNATPGLGWNICTLISTYCTKEDPGWRFPFLLKLTVYPRGFISFLHSEGAKRYGIFEPAGVEPIQI